MTTREFDRIRLGWPIQDPWTGTPPPARPARGGGSDPARILVPYSGTTTAERALDVAARLGLGRACVVWVLYVRAWDVGRGGGPFALESAEEARRRVQPAVMELRRRGVSTSAVVRNARRERVPYAIVAEAERLGVGCIVMGTQARRALTAALLGSTSLAVARRSTCPTILVKAARIRRPRRRLWRSLRSPGPHPQH